MFLQENENVEKKCANDFGAGNAGFGLWGR